MIARLESFTNRFPLHMQQEIIGAAGLGVGAGHIEAAKWLVTDDRTRALAVQIEITDMEVFAGHL